MTVLVSYVPTPEGWAAVVAGRDEARLRGTDVLVLNVAVRGEFAGPTFADEKDLDAVAERLTEDGVANEILQVIDAPNVADAILTTAAERHATLIVVALRRRSPVGKALLGSTAQQVILGADCPVLSVRPAG